MIWVLACASVSEPERFADALDPAVPLDEALAGCEQLPASRGGECATMALGARDAMTQEACQALTDPLWQDECTFQRAEHLALTELRAGLDACHTSRFARECSFHLIRSQARQLSSAAPLEAEARLGDLTNIPRAPDAAVLFFEEWHIAGRLDGVDARPERCTVLVDERPCVEALRRISHKTLRAMGPPGCEGVARGVVQDATDRSGALVPNAEILGELVEICAGWD